MGVLIFTFLMARRLRDIEYALYTVAALTLSEGFIENMRWIRVDPALAFFVAGAAWAFVEAFQGKRYAMAIWGGFFAAGAFLTKGVIGPVLIGIVWIAAAIPALISRPADMRVWLRKMGWAHGIAAWVLILLCGLWMYAFRRVAGAELWHEWFWENHFGRATGSAQQLGHHHPGAWWYYLRTICMYTLPFLPFLVVWARRMRSEEMRATPVQWMFPAIWAIGSVLLLSLPSTKRDIYLLPALPAFALMVGLVLQEGLPRWGRVWMTCLAFTIWTVLVACLLSPIWARFLPAQKLPRLIAFLDGFTVVHGYAGACLLFSCLFFAKTHFRYETRVLAALAAGGIGLIAFGTATVDAQRSMRNDFLAFADQIPAAQRDRIGAWNFDETALGAFYVYADWKIDRIDDAAELPMILHGRHPRFDSMVVMHSKGVEALTIEAHVVRARVRPMLATKRELFWITPP
jgi:hypothetical protein